MRFTVLPDDTSLTLMLEANGYQQLWNMHGEKIIDALKAVTGLEFQQELIEARVYNDELNSSGTTDEHMHLSGQCYSTDEKLATLMHELGHRLLGGNALGPVSLGLIPDDNTPHPRYQEYDHKHLYLFLFEVMRHAFGPAFADKAKADEQKRVGDESGHYVAWRWAMQLSPEHKQHAIERLAAQALPRSRWHERDETAIPSRDPADWSTYLTR